MQKYFGDSDIGSVLIGNDDWTFAVPNLGGDGTTKILVFDSVKEMEEFNKTHHEMAFISSASGRFNIYSYDCAYRDTANAHVLTTLEGRYGIYRGEYVVAFERWGDKND